MPEETDNIDEWLKLVMGSQSLEGQLPSTLPTQAAPIPMEVSSGRMYMGPALPASEEATFRSLPSGTAINLMPPPTPEESAGAAGRVAYAQRTMGGGAPYDPAMEKYNIQQQIQSAVAGGMPMSDAVRLYGLGMVGSAGSGRRYNVHGVGLVDESGKVLTPTPKQKTRPIPVAGVGLVDPDTGNVIISAPQTATETEIIPATEGSPGSPAIPARAGFLGIGSRPAVPEVPPIPAQGERRITRKVPIELPSESKGKLNKGQAASFLKAAGGDKDKARKMAVAAGYEL